MSRLRPIHLMLLLLFLTAGVSRLASAQARNDKPQRENKTAQKFDEFGDILVTDIKARLDAFAAELQNEPLSKGFILVYRTRRDIAGLSHRLAMRMKDYLVNARGLENERVVTVDGGIAEHLTQELWIVPLGTAPIPRSDARIGYLEQHDSAWKFDEYGFLPLSLYGRFGMKRGRDSEAEYLEAYADEIKKNQSQVACIIAYAQYNRHPPLVDWADQYDPHREARLDRAGTARNRLKLEKQHLMSVYGIPASRIQTIDGGYRKARGVELWIVPAGEPLPIPTPNSFPLKRKLLKK